MEEFIVIFIEVIDMMTAVSNSFIAINTYGVTGPASVMASTPIARDIQCQQFHQHYQKSS